MKFAFLAFSEVNPDNVSVYAQNTQAERPGAALCVYQKDRFWAKAASLMWEDGPPPNRVLKTTQPYCTNIAVVPNPNKGKKKAEGLLEALAFRLAEVWLFTTYR
jgi:hypothetical protein